jgi:Tfp pilus assembly protein PilZ
MTGASWHPGHVLNLSVTGVLVQVDQQYEIGERVEIEIDFFVEPDHTSVVSGVGRIVREQAFPRGAAIQFDSACAPRVTLP